MPMLPFTVLPADPQRRYFRVLDGGRPEVHDFYTDEAAGKVADLDEVPNWAVVRGFSVRATLPQARSLGRLLQRTHIAEFHLDGEDGSAVARTGNTRGHHTVWAKADKVLADYVIEVHPVDQQEQ